MKKYGILLALAIAFSAGNVSAQSKKEDSKITKQVEVNVENGETTLVITTTENGKTTVEEYTGDEAKAKMKELESEKGAKTKVFAFSTEDETEDENGHKVIVRSHSSTDDKGNNQDVTVTHKGNVMTIVTKEDGKETVKEIQLPDMKAALEAAEVDWKEVHESVKKAMEEAGVDLKELHKELKEELEDIDFDFSFDGEDGNVFMFKSGDHMNWHSDDHKVVINEEELTPEEIQSKYGIAIDEDDEDVVIVKHIIKVKRDGKSDKNEAATGVNSFVIGNNSVKIYPNPGKSDIQIEFNSGDANEAEIRLIDMSGKQLMKRTVKGSGAKKETLNTSKYPAGTYLVELKIGGEKIIQQIVLE